MRTNKFGGLAIRSRLSRLWYLLRTTTVSLSLLAGVVPLLANLAQALGQHGVQLLFISIALPAIVSGHAERRRREQELMREIKRELRRHGAAIRANRRRRNQSHGAGKPKTGRRA